MLVILAAAAAAAVAAALIRPTRPKVNIILHLNL